MKKDIQLAECFDLNSEYWKKAEKIINDNQQYKKAKIKNRQLHHIKPRSYFKKKKLPIDNTDDNLISLTAADHFLIHFYYWKAANQIIKNAMACAFVFMYKKAFKEIDENNIFINAIEYEKACKENSKYLSEKYSGKNNPNYNRKHTPEELKKMSEKNKKRIQCIETGKVFNSVKSAADTIKRKYFTISKVLHGKNKTAGGYHWKFFESKDN